MLVCPPPRSFAHRRPHSPTAAIDTLNTASSRPTRPPPALPALVRLPPPSTPRTRPGGALRALPVALPALICPPPPSTCRPRPRRAVRALDAPSAPSMRPPHALRALLGLFAPSHRPPPPSAALHAPAAGLCAPSAHRTRPLQAVRAVPVPFAPSTALGRPPCARRHHPPAVCARRRPLRALHALYAPTGGLSAPSARRTRPLGAVGTVPIPSAASTRHPSFAPSCAFYRPCSFPSLACVFSHPTPALCSNNLVPPSARPTTTSRCPTPLSARFAAPSQHPAAPSAPRPAVYAPRRAFSMPCWAILRPTPLSTRREGPTVLYVPHRVFRLHGAVLRPTPPSAALSTPRRALSMSLSCRPCPAAPSPCTTGPSCAPRRQRHMCRPAVVPRLPATVRLCDDAPHPRTLSRPLDAPLGPPPPSARPMAPYFGTAALYAPRRAHTAVFRPHGGRLTRPAAVCAPHGADFGPVSTPPAAPCALCHRVDALRRRLDALRHHLDAPCRPPPLSGRPLRPPPPSGRLLPPSAPPGALRRPLDTLSRRLDAPMAPSAAPCALDAVSVMLHPQRCDPVLVPPSALTRRSGAILHCRQVPMRRLCACVSPHCRTERARRHFHPRLALIGLVRPRTSPARRLRAHIPPFHTSFAAVRAVHVLRCAIRCLRSPHTPSPRHTRRRCAARAVLAASTASSRPVRVLDTPFMPSSSPPPAVHIVNAPPLTCLRRAVRALYAASSRP
ncbi:hypothetical protein DENSPDRAFT_886908 [Dentipellis sp. KUC8613]|nr:hypothetical protein DENSPDRAFT_886908 [Dentipellis sp. KUC8613]